MNYLVRIRRQSTGRVVAQYLASDDVQRTISDLFPPVVNDEPFTPALYYLEIVVITPRTARMFGDALKKG